METTATFVAARFIEPKGLNQHPAYRRGATGRNELRGYG
jgi:hypothetical protein